MLAVGAAPDAILQLIHEFRLLLLLGRTLCNSQSGVNMSMRCLVQYRAADGSIQERQVDLMFPATQRTVLRLVQAWWERKVSPLFLQEACFRPQPKGRRALPTKYSEWWRCLRCCYRCCREASQTSARLLLPERPQNTKQCRLACLPTCWCSLTGRHS